MADGELMLALPDQEKAVRTLSLLLKRLSPPGPIASTYFKERIKVEMRDVAPDKVVDSAEEAVRKLSEAASPKGEHEVSSGQSAWGIARQYGVSLNRLGHANPERDLERLRVGDKLKIPGTLSGLTVVATKEIEEKVGEGPRRRTQKVRITYENGVEVGRHVISRQRLPVESPAPVPERVPVSRRGRDFWRWRDEIPQ
jgi:LysM repeat protein